MSKNLISEPDPEPASRQEWGSETLVKALVQDDATALRYFYHTLGRQFLGWATNQYGYNPTLYQDILHDAMIVILKNLKSEIYQEEGNFKAYFFRIATITYYNRKKKQRQLRKKHDAFELNFKPNITTKNFVILHEEEREKAIQQNAMKHLLETKFSEMDNMILYGRAKGEKFQTIAEQIGKSEAATKMKYKRLIQKLQRLMRKEGFNI